MKENIQETSFCLLSLVPLPTFQNNFLGIKAFKMFLDEFCILKMKKNTHKKPSEKCLNMNYQK